MNRRIWGFEINTVVTGKADFFAMLRVKFSISAPLMRVSITRLQVVVQADAWI